MPVTTRTACQAEQSAAVAPANVPLNAKGHPSVGCLTIKKPNPFIEKCVSFEATRAVLYELNDVIDYIEESKIDTAEHEAWRDEVYQLLEKQEKREKSKNNIWHLY